MTPDGHAALAAGVRATGFSRSDYIEWLVRKHGGRLVSLLTTDTPAAEPAGELVSASDPI